LRCSSSYCRGLTLWGGGTSYDDRNVSSGVLQQEKKLKNKRTLEKRVGFVWKIYSFGVPRGVVYSASRGISASRGKRKPLMLGVSLKIEIEILICYGRYSWL
jgi:hypothetical protein